MVSNVSVCEGVGVRACGSLMFIAQDVYWFIWEYRAELRYEYNHPTPFSPLAILNSHTRMNGDSERFVDGGTDGKFCAPERAVRVCMCTCVRWYVRACVFV